MTDEQTGGQVPPEGAGYGTTLPLYTASGGRRRGFAIVGVAVGAALALVAGVFAVSAVAGDDGASDPEAAVRAMVSAVEDQDALGVLDALTPGERRVYQPFVQDMVGELRRLGVLADGFDLGSVDGVDIDVEGLELDSAPLGEGVSVVTITGGTVTTSVDPDEVPLGSFLRDLLDDPSSGVAMEPVTSTEPLADEPFDIVVLDDDGWHVNLHYSLAELAREAAGAPVPDFGNGVAPAGADSPEVALESMLQAAVDLDVRRMVALTPPGEMSVLHDYAPLFLDDVEAAVAEVREDTAFAISLNRLDTDVERDGDTATVTVSGFAASGTVDGADFEVSYDGSCVQVSYEEESEEICTDDAGSFRGMGAGMEGELAQELVDARLGVVTVEEGGSWYVSPLRSSFDVVLAVMGVVDRSDLEDPEQLLTSFFGINPLLGPAGVSGGGFGGDPYAECAGSLDDLPLDATDEEVDEAGRAYDECVAGVSGIDPGEPLPGEECYVVYDELPVEATDEQWAEADEAFDECFAGAVEAETSDT